VTTAAITKNTWKNLIVVTMIDFFHIFFANCSRYKINRWDCKKFLHGGMVFAEFGHSGYNTGIIGIFEDFFRFFEDFCPSVPSIFVLSTILDNLWILRESQIGLFGTEIEDSLVFEWKCYNPIQENPNKLIIISQ
jgi:hypothetical protein